MSASEKLMRERIADIEGLKLLVHESYAAKQCLQKIIHGYEKQRPRDGDHDPAGKVCFPLSNFTTTC